jgi:hypothetical protein
MEPTQAIPEWRAVVDEIWVALKESALRHAEIDLIMKENASQQAERSADLDKKIERVSANVGGINRSMGELTEILIAARLWEKFPE